MNLKSELKMNEDFITKNGDVYGVYDWVPQLSGDAIVGLSTAEGHPGSIVLGASTASTDQAYLYTQMNMFASFSQDTYVAEWCVFIPVLATTQEDFKLGLGLSVDTHIDPSVGAFFKYDRSASNNWRLITANTANGSETYTSSAAVTAGWSRLKIEFDPSTDYLTYSLNDLPIYTTNGNKIPTDPNTDLLGITFGIEKTAGTEQRDFGVDYSSVHVTFGATR